MSTAAAASPATLDDALGWWGRFDLPSRRSEVEAKQAEMLKRQDEAKTSRQSLLEQIKAFRKLTDAEKLEQLGAIMNSLQTEVNSQTVRSRAAEKAFFELSGVLLEAPNPSPFLELAADSQRRITRMMGEVEQLTMDLDDTRRALDIKSEVAVENSRMRAELAALEAELAKHQSQDITLREVERQCAQLEAQMEERVASRVAAREAEMQRVFEAELEAVREGETEAEARVAVLKANLAAAEAARDEAQAALYGFQQRVGGSQGASGGAGGGGSGAGGGEGAAAAAAGAVGSSATGSSSSSASSAAAAGASGAPRLAAEYEALAAEHGRVKGDLMAAQAEAAALRRRLAAALVARVKAPGGGAAADGGDAAADHDDDPYEALRVQADAYRNRAEAAEEEVSRVSSTLAALQQEYGRWEGVLQTHRKASESALGDLQRKLGEEQAAVTRLRGELEARPTHGEVATLRSTIQKLQVIASGGSLDDHQADVDADGGAGSSTSGGSGGASAGGVGAGRSRPVDDGADAAGTGAAAAAAGGPSTPPLTDDDVRLVLQKRVKALEARTLAAEGKRDEALVKVAAQGEEIARLTAAVAKQAALIASLEDAVAAASDASGGGSGAGRGGRAPGHIHTSSAVSLASTLLTSSAAAGVHDGTAAAGSEEEALTADGAAALRSSGAAHLASLLGASGLASSPTDAPATSMSANTAASGFAPGDLVSPPRSGFGGRVTAVPAASPQRKDARSGVAATPLAAAAAAVAAGAEGGAGDASAAYTLNVLRGQRDRFKQRVAELEQDLATRTTMLSDATARVERLTNDNVKLYEKIRFLQTYAGAAAATGGAAAAAAGKGGGGPAPPGATAVDVSASPSSTPSTAALASTGARSRNTALAAGSGDADASAGGSSSADFEMPYRRLYNEAHDPFADFSRRERTRQYEKLNAAERITLKSSQVLLGNKYARTILFFYVLIMHLLVFATLWHFSHVSHRDCDHGGEGGLVGGLAVRSSGPPGLSRLIPTGLRLPAGGADGVGDPALAVS